MVKGSEMSSFARYSIGQITALRERIDREVRAGSSLQAAAQRFVDVLYEEFPKSTMLVRLFGTARFEQLPSFDRDFVRRLAHSRGVESELDEKTVVVSLLGTRGKEMDWNDRRGSQQRLGIPLVSASFVKTIPLVSRLMSDVGTGLDWVEKQKTLIVVRSMGQMARVLYVDDASTAVSADGFKIVPAQEFVAAHGVRTVFALGGSYVNRAFVATVVFTNESIPQEQAERFMPVINAFKNATTGQVMSGRIFD